MDIGKPFIYAISALCLSVASIGACPAESIQTSVKVEAAQGKYWISSTGKTHNSSCRYYNNCKDIGVIPAVATTARFVVEQVRENGYKNE